MNQKDRQKQWLIAGDVNERLEAKLEELRHLDEMLAKLDAANEKAATKRGKETKTIKTCTRATRSRQIRRIGLLVQS